MRREVTLSDVLEREMELGWPLNPKADPAEEALRLELVAGNRWDDFPILKCFECGEKKPATAFAHDTRCAKRARRAYTCLACKEAGK